ncbi:NUDIX hydrolase [Myceligenerans indicum]|uniref:NUDIX domain-containing protein n=1 Tax=Myceligenerans indicum TaxID=2593663 RepID=A0ABS1LHX5_9MICO|nr:NUDIX domain-containing protein [Myceligenerans indicum]MBL0885733.1 NUDIX domain-containing protein [Myceligenerans indicum]
MTWRSDRSDRRRGGAVARPPARAGTVSPEGVTRSLGPDWRRAPDGLRERDAARVVLLDDAGRVLLVRGHDLDQPERSWWFTLGGGIDAGESAVEAALREVREEAGLALAAGDLVGPVLTRTGIFDFYAETCRQHEVFFLAHLPGGHTPDSSGWTEVEREVLDGMAWLTADELRAQPLEVFPNELPEVVDSLVTGWDGTIRHLGVQND